MLLPRFLPSPWGPLNKVSVGFMLRGCLKLCLSSCWSQHVSLTHTIDVTHPDSWYGCSISFACLLVCVCASAGLSAVWAFIPFIMFLPSCGAIWIVIAMFVTSSGQSWNCRSPRPYVFFSQHDHIIDGLIRSLSPNTSLCIYLVYAMPCYNQSTRWEDVEHLRVKQHTLSMC